MIIRTLFLCLCLSLSSGSAVWAQDRIIIGTGLKPPLVYSDTQSGFLDSLVTEAFLRIGIELEIIILPAARVLINANKGIEDGCLLRIKGLETFYPNLVRVPESLMVSHFVAYSANAINNQQNLEKFNPYNLSCVTGWKIFDKLFSNHPQVTKVKTADQMFLLLKKGRADVILYERWQGLDMLRKLEIKDIHLVAPPLVSMDMYMYLHKKHQLLVDKLASKLSLMKKDGTYQKHYYKHLESLLN